MQTLYCRPCAIPCHLLSCFACRFILVATYYSCISLLGYQVEILLWRRCVVVCIALSGSR